MIRGISRQQQSKQRLLLEKPHVSLPGFQLKIEKNIQKTMSTNTTALKLVFFALGSLGFLCSEDSTLESNI